MVTIFFEQLQIITVERMAYILSKHVRLSGGDFVVGIGMHWWIAANGARYQQLCLQ